MRSRARADRGAVTAEIAVALPSLVLVVGVALGAVHAAGAQVACADAARVGARALARGDPDSAVRALTAATAPRGASLHLDRGPDTTRVVVTAPIAAGLPVPITVHGEAVTPTEPGP
jgi:Flp pilus assembly protein TadG